MLDERQQEQQRIRKYWEWYHAERRRRERAWRLILLFLVGFAAAIFIGLAITMPKARAQDHTGHPPEHMQLHEQFYQHWNRPDMRNDAGERPHSCCNDRDCAPVDAVEYRRDGTIWMLRHSDQQWIKVPPEKLEHNYPDAWGTPDGRSHMCSSDNFVFCAVLGDGA